VRTNNEKCDCEEERKFDKGYKVPEEDDIG